jgi:glycosyltransferase involved in cell wall biosynthesis
VGRLQRGEVKRVRERREDLAADPGEAEISGRVSRCGPPRARIVVISQFFGQDQSAVGQFLADFASGASEAGHDVRVICGANDYASDEVAARGGNRHRKPSTNNDREWPAEQPAVDVEWVKTAAFSQNSSKKLLSYATFYAGAVWKALRIPKPDIVVTLTAPPGLAWIGWLLQRIRGCRHVTWEMDVYPDIAVSLGMTFAGWTAGLFDFPRRRADAVIVLGDCMKARMLRHGVAEARIAVAENWADGRMISPLPFPDCPPLRILYSGNLGLAHDIVTIRGVMERLAGNPDICFDFAGGGLERGKLMDFCREHGMTNASFRGYARQQDLGASLAECHMGLITQKSETLGCVAPSKLYGLMAAARPALYIGPAAATPALLIQRFNCGWHFECGDEAGVMALLLRLLDHPEEIHAKGQNGREAFQQNYDKPAGVARVIRALGLEAPANC